MPRCSAGECGEGEVSACKCSCWSCIICTLVLSKRHALQEAACFEDYLSTPQKGFAQAVHPDRICLATIQHALGAAPVFSEACKFAQGQRAAWDMACIVVCYVTVMCLHPYRQQLLTMFAVQHEASFGSCRTFSMGGEEVERDAPGSPQTSM